MALWATRSHREVRAETGMTRCGGDGHERWRRGVYSCAPPFVLPPPRGEADGQNAPPFQVQMRSCVPLTLWLDSTFLLRFLAHMVHSTAQ